MAVNKAANQAEKLATQPGAINPGGFTLLGVFGGKEDMRAMVRFAGGRISEIQAGSRIPAGTVAAVDKDGLMVLQNGEARRMAIPGN
ncbi:MAG: hypothetical protein ACU0BB_03915 [Paracoccaceae bacterium]|jgi:hypothetical protein